MKKTYLKASVEKGTEEGTYIITASTSSIDRQGDSIDQAGWELDNFKKNPVLLWAHDYSALPIGKVIGLEQGENFLKAKFQFAPADANPIAGQIEKLYEGGYVNASSVGFIPKERNGNIITRAELLELSLVPVPANQEALRTAVASKSLDISLIAKDLEKGAVADELNAEEIAELKWEKWSEISEVLSAFWQVFFDEATPVTDFKKLLGEVITLLGTVQANDGADDDASEGVVSMAMGTEQAKLFAEKISKIFSGEDTKSGATLSKKTLGKIDEAVSNMTNAITALEDLKKEAASADDQGGESTDVKRSDELVGKVVLSVETFELIRSNLRGGAKASEAILGVFNTLEKQNEPAK